MGDIEILSSDNQIGKSIPKGKQSKKGARREPNYVVRDLITCLALCHNVTPTYPDPDDPNAREF
jgi:hypothetical protein